MTAEAILRLALVPAAVWLASLAGRRWGHAVSGYLGGMPLIGGPITLFLAFDLGTAFAAESALFTLALVAGQAVHLLAFAHVGRRRRWPIALAAGWSGFALVAWAIIRLPLTVAVGAALAVAGLACAWRWLPRVHEVASLADIPPIELRLRLLAALALAGLVLWGAPRLGPALSGILLSLPITGSIIPPFTLAFHGGEALARLLRGFVVGLSGFASFFLVVTLALPSWGVAAAFLAATGCALAAVFAARHFVSQTRTA